MAQNETYFKFYKPDGYQPLERMVHRSYGDWISSVLWSKGKSLSDKLADKIINSLKRLPELEEKQEIMVSYSGGKDSEAIFLLALMRYGPENVFGLFADTHDEWPETYQAIRDFQHWAGVPIFTANSMGIHHMIRNVQKFWPQKGIRNCTKNLKLVPQRDWLDRHLYGQVRTRGGAMYRNADVGNGNRNYAPLRPAPQMLSGERWYESANRATLPFDSLEGVILRNTHRPVLDWHIEEIWEFIYWMLAPFNPIYEMGVQRCSCAGCIFASVDELVLLGQHHPNMLKEWVITESTLPVTRLYSKQSFAEIYEKSQQLVSC